MAFIFADGVLYVEEGHAPRVAYLDIQSVQKGRLRMLLMVIYPFHKVSMRGFFGIVTERVRRGIWILIFIILP